MPKPKKDHPLPPIKVRQEPPTVEEAVFAAQALTTDLEQQVEVAAGLMGLSADAVRPHVLNAPPLVESRSPEPPRERVGAGVRSRTVGPVVVVERRSRLPVNAPRPSTFGRPFQRG